MTSAPPYFEDVRASAARRWAQLERDPDAKPGPMERSAASDRLVYEHDKTKAMVGHRFFGTEEQHDE